jgi:hypothetical protein
VASCPVHQNDIQLSKYCYIICATKPITIPLLNGKFDERTLPSPLLKRGLARDLIKYLIIISIKTKTSAMTERPYHIRVNCYGSLAGLHVNAISLGEKDVVLRNWLIRRPRACAVKIRIRRDSWLGIGRQCRAKVFRLR